MDTVPHPDDQARGPSDGDKTSAPPGARIGPSHSVLDALRTRVGSELEFRGERAEGGDPAAQQRAPRYCVEGEIGRGGVGVVYRGRDRDLGRDVALKVLSDEHAERPDLLARFVEEAQIGGQLQHPGIVPVYEMGLQADRRPYFAMKLIQGETLYEQLARRADPGSDRRRFLGIFEQVCQTMAYAHSRRVVHRDLKPENVMIGAFGEVQVMDWGFAKVMGAQERAPDAAAATVGEPVVSTVRSQPGSDGQSIAGSMMGTPCYMPPEQARGDIDRVDQRSDVFGLGAILCEILTGEPPYRGRGMDVIHQAIRGELDDAYARVRGCGADEALLALCLECLSRDQLARPASAVELAARVSAYLTSVEERARRAELRAVEARFRQRNTLVAAAAILLLSAVGGGSWWWLEASAREQQRAATARVTAAASDLRESAGRAHSIGGDLGLWEAAAKDAQRLESLVGIEHLDATVGAELVARVTEFRAAHQAATARIAAAARDDRMRALLTKARIPTDDDVRTAAWQAAEWRRLDAAYRGAFAFYLGAELDAVSHERALAAMRSGALAVELAAALDHLCLVRDRLPAEVVDRSLTQRLRDLAGALDPDDPWRAGLRALLAATERSRDEVLALAGRDDRGELRAVHALLLSGALLDVGAADESLQVLRAARERFPQDFALAFELSVRLERAEHPDWERVVAALDTARAIEPMQDEVLHRQGMALERLNRAAESERLFRVLAERHDTDPHWAFHVGAALSKQGRDADAIVWHERALALDPNYVQGHGSLGFSYQKLGRYDEALASYRRAIALQPDDALYHSNIATILSLQGELDAAVVEARRAIALDGDDAFGHETLGWLLLEQGRADEAMASFASAEALAPDSATIHSGKAAVLRSIGRLDDALVSGLRAAELAPDDEGLANNVGSALLQLRRLDEAATWFRRAIAIDGDYLPPQRALCRMLVEHGDLEGALAQYRDAIAAGIDDFELHEIVGSALLESERYEESVRALRRASELRDDAIVSTNLGLAYMRTGRWQLAIQSRRRAVELAPNDVDAVYGLAATLKDFGQDEESVGLFRRAIALDADYIEAYAGLALALAALGDRAGAIDSYRAAIAIEPKRARLHYLIANVLDDAGRTAEAIASFRRAVELEPGMSFAWTNLGNVYLGLSDYDEAIACFERALAVDPVRYQACFGMGTAYRSKGDPVAALASYQRAVAILEQAADDGAAATVANVRATIAQVEAEVERLPRLLSMLDGEVEPDTPQDWGAVLLLADQRGRFLTQVRLFERIAALDPSILDSVGPLYRAAGAAARAGCGLGPGASELPADEARRLRGLALDWLSQLRQRLVASAAEGAEQRASVVDDLEWWQLDRRFACVRDRGASSALTAEELEAWRALWREVEQSLQRLRG